MSTEVLTQTLGAGGSATFGSGTQFLLVAASSPVTVLARSIGNSNKNRTFSGVPAGFKFTADTQDDGFDTLTITSPAAQTISISVGTDDVQYSNAVTVTGNVSTTELPTGAITDFVSPVSALATTANNHIVPVNGGRRKVALTVDPNYAGGLVYARSVAGAHDLLPMQAGLTYTFAGTYGVDVNNPNATAANIYVAEES
jgi:hypothetical protein